MAQKNKKLRKEKKIQEMQNKRMVLISIVVLVALFFIAGYMYNASQTQKSVTLSKEQALLFERPYSVTVGNKNAKVQLVEFFDPACEACADFHPYIKDIMEKNEGKIKLVLRYAPFHKNSNHAVRMLEGAREQGMFDEVLEFMFKTQSTWTQHHEVKADILWKMLSQVEGLDIDKLAIYMNSSKGNDIIKQDLEDASKLNVTKTPGYIVNGKPLQRFSLENLKSLINSEIQR